MRRIIYISLLLSVLSCNYTFDDLDIFDEYIRVKIVKEIAEANELTLTVKSYYTGPYDLNVKEFGHCYAYNTSFNPDTSAYKISGIKIVNPDEFPPSASLYGHPQVAFLSNIPLDNTVDSISVRSYIIFGDSLLYSEKITFNLGDLK